MAIDNYLGNGIGGAIGRNTGNGIVGSNTGKGIVGDNTGKGIVGNGGGNSTENVGNIYMHPPYAVIVEPTDEGGNVTQGNKNYQATYNAYKAAAAKLLDQTEEATNIKSSWSTAPKVTIDAKGNLTLNGSDAFLKSSEAKQLRDTLNKMKGNTYNTEDLNKQIEAWNSTLAEMAKGYMDTVDAMNQANYALGETAKNAIYHKLTFSDMQKIANSAKIGKKADARTTKDKIFVGFDWDENGKMTEKWVEAKKFFEEFNSIDDDKKRRAYRDLITMANNGDVAAYSKLTYLNGGAEGKPANVEYDATGDFFHTLGENLLTGLAEAADFITTYVPVFNTYRLTGRIVRAAESGDINDFFKADDIRQAINDYEEVVSWENAYLSEMTPGSTKLASDIGSVTGTVLGMAFSMWAGGIGNNVLSTMISAGVNSANQALMMTGKFTAFERTTVAGTQSLAGGAVRTASTTSQFLMPTALVEKFPNFAAALADKGLSFMQYTGLGAGEVVGGMPTSALGRLTGSAKIGTAGNMPIGAMLNGSKAGTLTVNTVNNGVKVSSSTILNTLSGRNYLSEKMFAKGLQTAFRMAPLAGESALRHTDQYFQKVNAGEDPGDMSDYIIKNTTRDMLWGAAFMGVGGMIKGLRNISKATKQSPAAAVAGATSENTQQNFYQDGHFTYDTGSRYLAPGGADQELQNLVSSIMTVNGESIFATTSFAAPIAGTNMAEAGRVFGAVSNNALTKLELEPAAGGAYVVKTVTNLETGTATTTKEFHTDIDEAMEEVRKGSVPKTTPKTVANADSLKDAKVAPIAINGVAPSVMPKGVSQVKVEPGIVYRTPDAAVEELASLAEKAGYDRSSIDSVYDNYDQLVKEAQAEGAAFEHMNEAPLVPRDLPNAEVDGIIRLAAWAKANGYNLIPFVKHRAIPTAFSKEDILNEGKRLSEFSVALYQDVRDLNSIRNSWLDNYEDFYELIKADTARDEDIAKRILSFERGKDSVSRDYLWDKLRASANESGSVDAFYDSSKSIIDSELERIEAVRRGARADANTLAVTADYKTPGKVSKRLTPSSKRSAIYDEYMDKNAKTEWFVHAQPGSKKAVSDSIKAHPELRNAMLSEMYELSGSELPYSEWLDTPIELHRVQIYDLPGADDDFLSFSMNEDWGDHWRSEYTDAGIYYGDVPGDDVSLTIKPRDTFGAHIVADNEVQNTEVLVPREAYMNAWENSDTVAKRSLANDAELDRLMEEESLEKMIKDQKAELAERKNPQRSEKDINDFYELSYEDRKKLVKEFVRQHPEKYVAVYRAQGTGIDDWYSNGTGVGGDPRVFNTIDSDKGNLENAVWLTTDENWVESSEKATAGGYNGSPDNIVVIPVEKNMIVDAGGEFPAYNPELGEADMSYLDSPYYSIRRFSELNGDKIVQTRGTMREAAWEEARAAGEDMQSFSRNRLNPKRYSQQELVLFKDSAPNVKSDGEQLVVDYWNDTLKKETQDVVSSRANQRAIGNLEREISAMEKELARLKAEAKPTVPEEKIVGTEYGVPVEYFSNITHALEWAKEGGERAVYELDENADTLDRPPVTTDDLALLQAGEPIQRLSAGGRPTEALDQFNALMLSLPTLDSPEDYTRGVIDIVNQVKAIYSQVAMNIDLESLYENYGRSIAEGKDFSVLGYEQETIRPLLQALDALGHYFDPSGKSLTQEFYLPTAPKPNKKINITDAILGKDGFVDEDDPVDGGLEDILLDPTRVGDSGFWQKRTGDLFRDANGEFTMAKSGTLEDALVAYTVSALTRGKNKLYVAAQNEVARSKFDRNRSQITSNQALAGLKDADTIRTKAKSIQANISKDAEALAELKENYSGDESTIDKALKEKNYADELNYTNALNTTAQKLGYNQFLQMNPIYGSAARFGGNATNFRGITNIRRKMERINVTGTAWVERFGEKVNVGFGLDATPANQQIYGDFKPEKAINLGKLINLNFDSDRAAVAFLHQINTRLAGWAEGDGWDLMHAITEFARDNFPLSDSEWYTAQLMKKIGQNYNKYNDAEEIFIANAETISNWITRGTLDTFNKAIQMTNISNLDNRTINALDEAAAYMLIGTPVKRSKIINYAQEAAVWSALGLNPRVTIGNMLNEPLRLIDVVGYKGFTKAWKTAMNPKEAARINTILGDLPSRFDNPEMVGLANKAKGAFGSLKDKAANVVLSPLEKSEQFKNILFWAAAEQNAAARFPGDKDKQLQETLRFFNDYAIAGGKGTVPGIATGSFGRTVNIFKTFTLRNFDDFIDYVEKVARGESGNNYWDSKYQKKHEGKNYKDKKGRNKFDPKIAARVVGGRILRSYMFWLMLGSYVGKSFVDILGGDPTGITEGGFDRGLYDDPDTDEYEGMTGFDNFINSLPAGFILGFFQDAYFAARRRGVDQGQFLGFDILNDPKFTRSMESKLPLGVAKNRFADMLDLVDRGYSFSSTGRKTYAAPETALDTLKGFLFGKATTQNSLAYGKYRYGMVDIWGDLSSGDWLDFAMNANPINNITGAHATFDTTREDYTGVFNGSWNDVSTMQLIIQQFRQRQQGIIDDFQRNKYRYSGEYEGLSDEEKVAKAKEQREKDIDKYTEDVSRAVDAYTKAGNALSDSQITTMMYLFDFHEGEEDDEWNSSYARQRYVEAGLPDYDPAGITRTTNKTTGEEKTQNALDRSLVIKNAEQGFYGSSKAAANAIKDALKDFKSTYKEYNTRVKALNEKYFAARNKNKKSSETKQLSKDLEKLQNEYLDKLFDKIEPVIDKYGTALVGTYDGADVLAEYMGNMIPYSSIKKYGQTYSSGNDIVYGQLTEWLQKRLGRNAPTAPSDKEVTNGIKEIKSLLDRGKTATARSKARAILEKIGRGSLGARRDDVETLRSYLYD